MSTSRQINARAAAVTPMGQAVSIVAVGIMFSILITGVVWLRIYVRLAIRRFGADDWLMCGGWVSGLVNNAVLMWGAFFGLGMVDSKVTDKQMIEAEKSVFAWGIVYAVATTFVKVSICVALLRLAEQKSLRIILWIAIVITTSMNLIKMLAALIGCRPISSAWDPSSGSTCMPNNDAAGETLFIYIEFAVYIAVDMVCVLLPCCIVWNLRMKKSLKLSTAGVLGLGVVATIAAIIRLPMTLEFTNTTDTLWYRGRSVIWAMVELNLGIIAGSVPPLQKLQGVMFGPRESSLGGQRNTPPAPYYPGADQNEFDLVTIGQMLGRRRHSRQREQEEDAASLGGTLHDPEQGQEHDSASLHVDDESTRRMIKTTNTEETAIEIASIDGDTRNEK